MDNEILYTAYIPIDAVTKKNSQRILYKFKGKTKIPFIAPSEKFIDYQNKAGYFLTRRPHAPINEPVEITCIFKRATARQCDLTNLLEAVDDILVKYGIIADDNFNIIKSHDGSRVVIDKEHYGTYIIISRFKEGQ